MERSERFALFVQEMEEAAPAASFEEARQLLEARLNQVEDAHAGVPFNPENWRDDGRMYPPHDDFERKTDVAGVRMFRTRGHRVWIADNGAIRITTVHAVPQTVLDKAGKDGGSCPA